MSKRNAKINLNNGLSGKISAQQMAALNAAVEIKRQSETAVAASFLLSTFKVSTTTEENGIRKRLYSRTLEHLFLVGISLVEATLVAIPLGILSIADILQTIPKLALLVFMIPLLGIGSEPAIAALFLYSLLLIIRNTHTGINGIDLSLQNSAIALGLPPAA